MIKQLLVLIIKISIIVFAFAYLFTSGKLEISQLHIEQEKVVWICTASIICLILMVLSYLRLWLLLQAGNVIIRLGTVIRIGFISWLFSATLMGGLGFLSTDAVKIGYLMNESRNGNVIINATLLDRAAGLLGLVTLAVFALYVGWEQIRSMESLQNIAMIIYSFFLIACFTIILAIVSLAKGRLISLIVWVSLGGAIIALMYDFGGPVFSMILVLFIPMFISQFVPSFLPGSDFHNILERYVWLGKSISAFILALMEYRSKTGTFMVVYLLSLIIHFLIIFSLFLIGKGIAIEYQPTLSQIWFAAPPVNLLSILPLPANGLGVGEAMFDSLLGIFAGPDDMPLTGGAAIYLSFRILMIILGFTGLLFYLHSPKH